MASTVITSATLFALGGGVGHAADAAGPLQTANPAQMSLAGASPNEAIAATGDAAADTTSSTAVTEIVVTGSRIPQPNLTSVSPIQAVSHQEFQLQGATDVIDLLNTLPQNFQNNAADFSNTTNPLTAPGGVSTADLRGLGPQRTLVLVNGRRLGIGDPNTGDPNPAPDLDQIPVSLIDHVEVLTGGASATYGSDAVAGVVNFIMKKDFEGVQVDGQYGGDQHSNGNTAVQQAITASGGHPATGDKWDGQNTDFSVIFGANAPDGKGNVTGYFEFKNADPVTEGERDYSGCLLVQAAPDLCANSSNSNQFFVSSSNKLTVVGSSFLPYPQAGSVPGATFNSSPYEYLSRQDTRYLGGFFAHYDINDWAQPYAEFSFMNDRSSSAIAPSGLFEGAGLFAPNGGYFVNCGNPLLSAQESAAIGCTAAQVTAMNQSDPANQIDLQIGRRNIEGGARTAAYEHDNYRIVIGMKGDLGDAWRYDAYGSYYYTSLFDSNGNYLSLSGIQNALLVGGTAAAPVCLNGSASCIPYNIFNQGGVTPAQVASLNESGTSHGTIEEQIFEGFVTGDLGKYGVKSPWADDGVGVSIGIQHRWDHLVFAPDQAELSGDLAGFSGASVPVNNAISVQEEYGELRIPIAQKRPFADDLSIEAGYRYSDYSTAGGVSTYKVGGEWAPVRDVRFRASYDRAIRAASILEAFSPPVVTNSSIVSADPCSGTAASPATATLAQCMLTGVTAAEYGNGGSTNQIAQCPAGQCTILESGTAGLKPEQADTYSVGFTITPSFLRGFSGSIDYYDIKIANEIGTVPISLDLVECLNGGPSGFCAPIHRTPGGFLFGSTIAGGGYIAAPNLNVASAENSGVDFQADYRLPLEMVGAPGMGSVSFHFVGTYLISQKTQVSPLVAPYDCAGLFGPTCATDNPVWRHSVRITWNTPWNVLASLQWRYLGSTSLDANSTQSTLALLSSIAGNGAFGPADNQLSSRSYLDLSGAWRVNGTLTIRAGVNNLLDQDPPVISQPIVGIGEPNAYPTYDLLGRQIFISATAKF
ncbi:MAG TPA: TonB-dependent receptor [Caulobacteraceae bacterium]|nr:TonB-dependent receptor [Caulobacteraceae bacterium]